MGVYFRCKSCGGAHPSPIGFGDKKSFDISSIKNNSFQCPKTGQTGIYNKEDMFWKER
jgi:hypothetical protein